MAAVGHARELRHSARKRCTWIEEEQRDGMVIGTCVGTAGCRKIISGDWTRTEKDFDLSSTTKKVFKKKISK